MSQIVCHQVSPCTVPLHHHQQHHHQLHHHSHSNNSSQHSSPAPVAPPPPKPSRIRTNASYLRATVQQPQIFTPNHHLQQVIITTTTMSTLTRTIAHAEAECKQMHSPNRKRHQTSSSPMQIQGTEQGEDPNNNNHDHHDSVTKVHSTSMCPAESNITSAPTSQNSQTLVSSRTHFNVLNVS